MKKYWTKPGIDVLDIGQTAIMWLIDFEADGAYAESTGAEMRGTWEDCKGIQDS